MIGDSLAPNLEKFSKNLESDDKATRLEARRQILVLTENFKKIPELPQALMKKMPNWFLVKQCVEEFNQGTFPFQIDINKSGRIKKKIPVRSELQRICEPRGYTDKPAYVALIPHHPKLNGINPHAAIFHQIKLLGNESFLETPGQSRAEAQERLRVIIGINYCDDLDSKVNKAFKKYIERFPCNRLTSQTAFAWEPVWANKGLTHTHSKVKRLAKLFFAIDAKKASKLCLEAMKLKTEVIPYQHLREHVKEDPLVARCFKALTKKQPHRPRFIWVGDDDNVHLRTGERGLFSHYDDLIAQNPALEVATTGYVMKHPDEEFIEIATNLDLVSRLAIAIDFPNGPYISEPNILIRFSKKISFLRRGRGKGLESIALLENLKLMKVDAKGRIIWGQEGPIETSIPPRVSVPQHIPSSLKAADLTNPKVLASFRAFCQSSVNPIAGFASNLCRTLPKGFGSQKSHALVANLFTPFDPIHYAKTFPNWLELYKSLARAILDICDDIENDQTPNLKTYSKRLIVENNLTKKESNRLNLFLETEFAKIYESYQKLTKAGLDKSILSKIVDTSCRVGFVVHDYLAKLIKEKKIEEQFQAVRKLK